ncbi:MAG: tyrosine-type recombinase/integrase [Nitrosomonadaceae bacterium]
MGKQRQSNKHLPERMYLKGRSYYYVNTDNKWVNLGRNYSSALIQYAGLVETGNIVTVNHLITEFTKSLSGNNIKDRLPQLENLGKSFGHMRPAQITPPHIYAYMDARRAPARANKEKATLSRLLDLAVRKGLVGRNVCREVKQFALKPRDRYVTADEFWAVHDIAPVQIQLAMRLAIGTGARQHNILDLQRKHLKDEGIEIDTGKGGKAVLVEWTDFLLETVRECKKSPSKILTRYMIHNRQGDRYTRTGFSAMFRRAVDKALSEELITEKFTFHDLRAKAATDSQDEHLLGHQDPRTYRKYYVRTRKTVHGKDFKRE